MTRILLQCTIPHVDDDWNVGVLRYSPASSSPTPTGSAIVESSFHHFADYNWDTSCGGPSFVTEPEGDGMRREPRALEDIQAYVANAARWLAP